MEEGTMAVAATTAPSNTSPPPGGTTVESVWRRPDNTTATTGTTPTVVSSSPSRHRPDTVSPQSSQSTTTTGKLPSTQKDNNRTSSWGQDWFFIATWGIFGAVARVYMGRFFGGDCEQSVSASTSTEQYDFWQATNICITATGMTDRRGGALFIDLPANIMGSFLMGLLSASTQHPIPWFPAHHHLQRHAAWHKGLTTGLCGCLTTFASWNTQMVAMLDGTNAEHGSQILSAIVGYVIGLLTAIAAFLWGRVVSKMMWNRRDKASSPGSTMAPARTFDEHDEHHYGSENEHTNDDEEQQQEQRHRWHEQESSKAEEGHSQSNHSGRFSCPSDEESASGQRKRAHSQQTQEGIHQDNDEDNLCTESSTSVIHLGGSVLSFGTLFITVLLVLGFVYGDVAGEYIFYRRMWMACFLTPLGAIARSQLKQWLPSRQSIQWGTWTANILGAVLSVLLRALVVRYLSDDGDQDSVLHTMLWALQVGFAGSLSTVSTFVKELVGLERLLDRHLYGILTLLVAMSLGLAIYSPIVRL